MSDHIVDQTQRGRLAQAIKTLCAYYQISLKDLATQTGLNYSVIGRMGGHHLHAQISPEDVEIIAEYFKLKAEDLLEKQIQISFKNVQ